MTELLVMGQTTHLTLPACSLEILEGPGKGQKQTFQQHRITVGRAEENDFCVPNTTVSRMHFVLVHEGQQGYRLRDMSSTNGVMLGALKVLDAYLQGPTQVRLGNTLLLYTPGQHQVELSYNPMQQSFGQMAIFSDVMADLSAKSEHLAQSNIPLMLLGETGVGKGAFASEIHRASPRRDEAFVVLNCAAIPSELFESELFGHAKGAFTGASQTREGAFQRAHGGTLFLDEIGELPLHQQAKLLTVLDKGEFFPLGGNSPVQVDVRLVSATNRDLHREMALGRFRKDLFFRLGVVELQVPPLRERPDEIHPLAQLFLEKYAAEHPARGIPSFHIDAEALLVLKRYRWPGNIRELRNAMYAAASLTRHDTIEREHLPPRITSDVPADEPLSDADSHADRPGEAHSTAVSIMPFKEEKLRITEQFELQYLRRLLELTDDKVADASTLSGLNRKHIYTLKKKYGL